MYSGKAGRNFVGSPSEVHILFCPLLDVASETTSFNDVEQRGEDDDWFISLEDEGKDDNCFSSLEEREVYYLSKLGGKEISSESEDRGWMKST